MGKKKEKKAAEKLAKKLEKAKDSKKKSKKKKKTAECDGLQVCSCCKKHCPLTAPKCDKGKKLAKKLGF